MIIAYLVWALLILFLYRSHAFVFFLLKKTKQKTKTTEQIEMLFQMLSTYSFQWIELKHFPSANKSSLPLVFHTKFSCLKYPRLAKNFQLDKTHTELSAQSSILLTVTTLTSIPFPVHKHKPPQQTAQIQWLPKHKVMDT